jgi:hypothetical protein
LLAQMRSADFIEHVRVRGQSGKHLLALSSSQFDPKATSEASNDKCSYGRLPLSKACSSR